MSTPNWISIKQVCELTSLSRTAVNKHRQQGRFPLPVEAGERRVAFLREEVLAWMAGRQASRPAVDRLAVAREERLGKQGASMTA